MFDKLFDEFVPLRHFAGPEGEHVPERLARPATLPDVVHDHLPVVRVDNKCQQAFGFHNQPLLEIVTRAGDHHLLDQGGQSLGTEDVWSLGVLILVIMQEFKHERQFQKGVFLRTGRVRWRLAPLNFPVQRQQLHSLVRQQGRVLGEQRLKIRLERQCDLLRLGTRVQFRIGGYILEKDQRFLAEFLHNSFPGDVPLDPAAIGPCDPRREKQFRPFGQRPEHFRFQGSLQPDQFLHRRFQGGHQVPLCLLQRSQNHRLRQVGLGGALDQRRQHLVHVRVVLDQF